MLAGCIVLYILLPRALLAAFSTLSLWRWSLRAPVPAWLPSYFRSVFAGNPALDAGALTVVPYAYAPSAGALAQLAALLRSALEGGLAVNMREQIPYGDEQAFLDSLSAERGSGELVVVLLNLAATPEDENHGVLVSGLRERLGRGAYQAPVLVLVDEGPYAQRMGAQGGAGERMSERRRTWEAFAHERAVPLHFVNLTRPRLSAADAEQRLTRMRSRGCARPS